MNLIITPVFRAYDKVLEMCNAIDQNTHFPYLHILIDDDSGIDEPFPVKASENRRIIMLKRDYEGVTHKTGEGQAIQLAYNWATQPVFNGVNTQLSYNNIFMIESDVIVQKDWDQKMIDIIPTLPEDWLTLDQQSLDFNNKLVYPTTNWGSKIGEEREDLEITIYPDFQCTLFNQKIFESGIDFSSLVDPVDSYFGRATSKLLGGRHFRTKLVSSYHYISQSIKHIEKISLETLIERVKDIDSYILNSDLEIYRKYISDLPNNPTILDVGTGKGKSAIAMSLCNPRSKVITVDNGTMPVVNRWAKNEQDYEVNIHRTIKIHGIDNCKFICDDIFNIIDDLPKIDVFHLDDEELEGDILEAILPLIKSGGVLLIRNYLRFKERVDQLCKGYEFLEYEGLIQVIKKISS